MGKQKISQHGISVLEYLHKKKKLAVSDIIKLKLKCLNGLSRATIYKHATGKFGTRKTAKGAACRRVGRPSKITEADKRSIRRAIPKLRSKVGLTFSVADIQKQAGLTHVSKSAVRKTLNKLGYKKRVARKKGHLSAADKKQRHSWAKKYQNWTKSDWQ